MIITLVPRRAEGTLVLHRAGDVLRVNGVAHDFTPLPEGAVLPRVALADPAFASDVTRIGGALHLGLFLPHGPDAPEALRFPAALHVTADGEITLPAGQPEEDA